MLPVLIFCLLIQLGPNFKARALPNTWPGDARHSLKSGFVNVLDSTETDGYLSTNGCMGRQPNSHIIASDQRDYGKLVYNHDFPIKILTKKISQKKSVSKTNAANQLT
jgi:hypothetical protein